MKKRMAALLAVAAVASWAVAATVASEGKATVIPHSGLQKKAPVAAKALLNAEGTSDQIPALAKVPKTRRAEGYSNPGSAPAK